MPIPQEDLSSLIQHFGNGLIIIDYQGKVVYFNVGAEILTGLERAEVIGQKLQNIWPDSRLFEVIKTGQHEVTEEIQADRILLKNRFAFYNGESRVVGAIEIIQDITLIKDLENKVKDLQDEKELLKAIIDSTQDAISVADDQGRGFLINQAYKTLTGLTETDIINKPASVDIVAGESVHLQVLKTKEPVSGVQMIVGPYKKEVIVNVAPIILSGKYKGSVGVIHDVSEIRRLTKELDNVKRRLRYIDARYTFDDIVAESPNMQLAIAQARKAAETSATILLRGESGTGKEMFAQAIHNASPRNKGKFIRVNCAAIPESLLESELFGYSEGAFTGAKKGGRNGLFEEAKGGTIFLDEIGEMNFSMQSKLLRVIQEKEILRIGESNPIPVDVRIIAATNVNLEKAIEEKLFREDLYYRLNVFPIFIPALRHRKEDIPQIIQYLINKFNQEYGRKIEGISNQSLQVLLNYSWVGNVRELENVIARAIINMHYSETIIELHHLPSFANIHDTQKSVHPNQLPLPEKKTLAESLQETEKNIIRQTLKETKGNKTKAAALLGIAIRTLYYKLEQYEIE